jgi:sugar/nucleoside kinase (ribokinase family)
MTRRQPRSSGTGQPVPIPENRPTALGTGLLALDVIFSEHLGDQPAVAAGGTCCNVLTALSFFGWASYPIARLNGDPASVLLRSDLSSWGVALEFAEKSPVAATPIVVQTSKLDRQGRRGHRFKVTCPSCGSWFPSFRAVTRAAAEEVLDSLHGPVDGRPWPSVFFFDRVSRGALVLADELASRGTVVVFEPQSAGEPRLFAEAMDAAHIIKYSAERFPRSPRTHLGRRCVLEIQTLGDRGLRYRSRLAESSRWFRLPSIPAPRFVDAAGAGDWCTAGTVSNLAESGQGSLFATSSRDLRDAIRMGQSAAALACCLAGARGLMDALASKDIIPATMNLLNESKSPQTKEPARRMPAPFTSPSAENAAPNELRDKNHAGLGPLCSKCGWVPTPTRQDASSP